jgi:aconitate hydratase
MGVLPLQFREREGAASHGLTGRETFTVRGVARLGPRSEVVVEVRREDGSGFSFPTVVRVDSSAEIECLRQGGILPLVAGRMGFDHRNP